MPRFRLRDGGGQLTMKLTKLEAQVLRGILKKETPETIWPYVLIKDTEENNPKPPFIIYFPFAPDGPQFFVSGHQPHPGAPLELNISPEYTHPDEYSDAEIFSDYETALEIARWIWTETDLKPLGRIQIIKHWGYDDQTVVWDTDDEIAARIWNLQHPNKL